jgi:AcrR family transcriptional regulator/DNA-binding MarR family transcriptional regulator
MRLTPDPHRLHDGHEHAAAMAEFQRARLLRAALVEVSERGFSGTPVARIIARAGVSRSTFYELFESREDCFAAVFDESVAQLARAVVPAYEAEDSWADRIRLALEAGLAFLEAERDVGGFVLEQLAGHPYIGLDRRAAVLERVRDALDEGRSHAMSGGRSQTSSSARAAPLTADCVMGGALAVIKSRLRKSPHRLSALLNPLMWMIVLPYLGPEAATAELHRPVSLRAATQTRSAAISRKSASAALDGLQTRMTYRTARVLAAIAQEPGASNVEIAARAQIADQSQASKLLARLERSGLIESIRRGHAIGAAKAWYLTSRGTEVDAALRRTFATGARRCRERGDV